MDIFSARAALVVALTASTLAGCAAAPINIALAPKDKALASLRTLTGQHFALEREIARHRATLLVFWASRCPCVERYRKRIAALRADFSTEEIAMLAIASNADDDRRTIASALSRRPFPLQVLFDPGGAFARRLGVRSTPTVVLVDRARVVRFRGWIDNEKPLGAAGRRPYLRMALQQVIKGELPPRSLTPVYGCTITRSLFGEKSGCAKSCGADGAR